jgi:hypothetical protein
MACPKQQVPMALELPQGRSGTVDVVVEEAEADTEAIGAKAPNNDRIFALNLLRCTTKCHWFSAIQFLSFCVGMMH